MKAAFIILLVMPPLTQAAELWPADLICNAGGKIKFIFKNETKIEAASYCFSADHSYFLSSDCRQKPCAALGKGLKKIPDSALTGKLGSPGFKLCRQAGGDPQLLEYTDGEHWWPADRCLFPRDGSFVDTGILVRKRSLEGKN